MTSIPPKWRRILYWVGVGIGIIIGCVQVWYSTTGYTQPIWLLGLIAVFAFLGAAVNAMAGSNVDTTTDEDGPPPLRAAEDHVG